LIADPNPGGFYVYQLADPRTDLPFYIGKGQSLRAWQHERAVRAGKLAGNARKVAAIQEIIARGLSVQVSILACYDSEADALDHEFRLVDSQPTLTNIVPGGGGGPLSAEATARRMRARRIRLERIRARELVAREAAERQASRERHMAAGRSEAERQQIAEWLDSLPETVADKMLIPATKAAVAKAAQYAMTEPPAPKPKRGRSRQFGRRMGMQDQMFGEG
jgi:hypothetical protein